MDYKTSGVDIEAGERAVQNIKNTVQKTFNENVLAELGSFGGMYRLDLKKWREPIMVSSTDGVGTKIIVAQLAQKYDTIGQDLVNHCVNDIFVHGAHPQFFNDYIGLGKMDSTIITTLISGMAKACLENEMSLIGGEMAEMPCIYREQDFDLVGTIVGLVEQGRLITGSNIQERDVVIGLYSTGLHTNGYSLARKIIFEQLKLTIDSYIPEIGDTVGNSLLRIHKSYYPELKQFAVPEIIHGMAHITGGGLVGNIQRILPEGLSATINCRAWECPTLFQWLVDKGKVPLLDAYSAFNMGLGMVIITPDREADTILTKISGVRIGIIQKQKNNKSVFLNF